MAVMQVNTKNDIFHIVFCIVLFSILLQGSLLPLVSRKLDMLDSDGDVMKTFTDYMDEVPVQFIQSSIHSGHSWCGRNLSDILMPPDTIAALLKRGAEKIVPNGSTVLAEGDKLILCAKSPAQVEGVFLSERELKGDDHWIGKTLFELPEMNGKLIIMIMRDDKIIIPRGDTVLEENDVLVINNTEQEE